jgi:signal transduction histidine kinase
VKDWTLRRKIVLWSAASTGLVLFIFSLGTIITLYVEQIRGVDAELIRDLRLVREETEIDPTPAALRIAQASRPWLQVGIADKTGALLDRSARFPSPLGLAEPSRKRWHTRWVAGTLWRTRAETIGDRTVILAQDLDSKPDFIDELLGAYLISLPLALMLVAGAAWWLGRRALAPVSALADAAAAITAEHLAVRLPVPNAEDDLARLARVLNGMLERLERSFHQARRFAADASHELRTPLTIMQGEVEAVLREGRLDPAQEKRMVSLLEETARLDRVTGSLLMLAQFDSGKSFLTLEPLDLSALVNEACEDAGLLGAQKRLRFQNQIAPGIVVRGDGTHIRRLLINLFDNAVKFNCLEGTVVCTLAGTATEALLSIGNSGPGIGVGQRDQLFERFSRLGTGQARGTRGHGLGLSLCREIVAAHLGRIELTELSTGSWTEFVVALPLSSDLG